MPLPKSLKNAPKYLRSTVLRDDTVKRVDEEGGRYGYGLIHNVAAITTGEALGHGEWIDEVMVQQVYDALAAKNVKVRFTHPGLSSDGLGKYLGTTGNPWKAPGRVLLDINFSQSSRNTPDGDLGGYVMQLTQENSEALGMSIVFEQDFEAEDEFYNDHTVIEDGHAKFVSPDPANVHNFHHVRLKKLRAVDVVDEPASNPNGMFHVESPVLSEARQIASFALGIASERPECVAFSAVNPERIRGFVARFLEEHQLEIKPKEDAMASAIKLNSDPNIVNAEPSVSSPTINIVTSVEVATPEEEVVEEEVVEEEGEAAAEGEPAPELAMSAAASIRASAAPYIEMFGETQGAVLFCSGVDLDTAKTKYIASLRESNQQLSAKLSALTGADIGGQGSVSHGASASLPPKAKAIRVVGQ